MSISRRPCGVRPLCRVCLTRWRLRDVWYRSHQSVHGGRKFKENTCPYGMVGMCMCRHRLTPTTQWLDALPLALSTVISFYCTLKKQVLRFTSVYLMRAGYLFAFLFYPRVVGSLQYLDLGYCSCFTVHYLHSFPAKSKSLFHFATEKLTT